MTRAYLTFHLEQELPLQPRIGSTRTGAQRRRPPRMFSGPMNAGINDDTRLLHLVLSALLSVVFRAGSLHL